MARLQRRLARVERLGRLGPPRLERLRRLRLRSNRAEAEDLEHAPAAPGSAPKSGRRHVPEHRAGAATRVSAASTAHGSAFRAGAWPAWRPAWPARPSLPPSRTGAPSRSAGRRASWHRRSPASCPPRRSQQGRRHRRHRPRPGRRRSRRRPPTWPRPPSWRLPRPRLHRSWRSRRGSSSHGAGVRGETRPPSLSSAPPRSRACFASQGARPFGRPWSWS